MSNIIVEFTPEEVEEESRKIFGSETSRSWSSEPEYNRIFLEAQQAYMSDLLFARGYLFLNEVYRALDLPDTKLGAVLGWTKEHRIKIEFDPELKEKDIALRIFPMTVVVNSDRL